MIERGFPYDVPYGLASTSISSGTTIVTTTGADYHGIAIVAGSTAKAKVTLYDNASSASGRIIDVFVVDSDDSVWIDRYIPVKAKNGIVVSIVGTDASGAVFYNPKG